MAENYNYTLDIQTASTPDNRVKRSYADVASPSDDGAEGLFGAPPTSRMREYSSPDNQSNLKDMSSAVHVATGSIDLKTVYDSLSTLLQPLTQKLDTQIKSINELTVQLAKQSEEVTKLKSENFRLKHRLEKAEESLHVMDCKIEDLEQYSRRSSIRFFNVSKNYKITKKPQNTEEQSEPTNESSVTFATPQPKPADMPDPIVDGGIGDQGNGYKQKVNYEQIVIDTCNEKINVSPPPLYLKKI